MDFTALLNIYNTLPSPAQDACAKVTVAVLGKFLGTAAWEALRKKQPGAALACVYRQWQEGLLESVVDEKAVAWAFQDFFCRPPTQREIEKLFRDQYEEIDFNELAQMLRESCQWANCPLPENNLHEQLDLWIQGLEALVDQVPDYRQRFQVSVTQAIRNLEQLEPGIRNFSLARHAYLRALSYCHRLIQFRGVAEIGGVPQVELARVFVMPRVVARADAEHTRGRPRTQSGEDKPKPASGLLQGKKAAGRVVILGKPGSGKTTLLEYFALALANREAPEFRWAAKLPGLLPVFCRARDLDQEMCQHPGKNIWECLHFDCAQSLGLNLPAGFFRRQMAAGGLLVLFDGLDEVPSESRRIQIVDRVSAFARDLSRESRAIITSRPHEYARVCFAADEYRHFDLCEFNDDEIQEFINTWYQLNEPGRVAWRKHAGELWHKLKSREDILPLARNPLLLTMIVRVHSSLSALPEGRLDLYRKCTDTLLKYWTQAKGLESSVLDLDYKHKFLGRVAFERQRSASAEELSGRSSLEIPRAELTGQLEDFLRAALGKPFAAQAEGLIERLHARDAILVSLGNDRFSFVHRSFQEYFAAWWMAEQLDEREFEELVFGEPPGWNETLYLAVAQLPERRLRGILVKLLQSSRVPFALACLKTATQQDLWLKQLVQFLSRYYWEAEEYLGLSGAECADSCLARAETTAVLRGLFDRETRDGQALAAAVELAEELARRGNTEARKLLDGFFAEAEKFGLRSQEKMARIDKTFFLDRLLVTNRDYESMVPSHHRERDQFSDADDQPVICVNSFEAQLYCRWRGPGFRLPTEQEWEKAASWDQNKQAKRKYPWGDEFDPSRCNTLEGGPGKTTPVGAYLNGASAYGCYDMAGNVFEWTGKNVLRGGAWDFAQTYAACACRYLVPPHARLNCVGFRCAWTSL